MIVHYREADERTKKRQYAWKVLMQTISDLAIGPVELANELGISQTKAMLIIKGDADFELTDNQFTALGKLTNQSANFWKHLFN